MKKIARYFILALVAVLLVPNAVRLAWAVNTILTESTTWCASVSVPSPGDPVRASGLTGGIRTALQCFADRTHAIVMGTVSVKALSVDGVGAQASAVPGGNILTTGTIAAGQDLITARSIGGTLPNTAVIKGDLNMEQIPSAGGSFKNDGSGVYRSFGVKFFTRMPMGVAHGDYLIEFQQAPTGGSKDNSVIIVQPALDGAQTFQVIKGIDMGTGNLTVEILFNGGTDAYFDLAAWIL